MIIEADVSLRVTVNWPLTFFNNRADEKTEL